MRKYINWASLLIVILMVYAICSTYIEILPNLPLGDWDIFPTLSAVAVAIAAKDLINSRKYIDLINNGEIQNFPAVMAALEKYDKHIYKIIMNDYYEEISNKIDKLNAYIEEEKYQYLEKTRDNSNTEFDIRHESHELYTLKLNKNLLVEINKGNLKWEDVCNNSIKNKCILYTTKFLLNEIDEDDKNKILNNVQTIERIREGGNNVNIKHT